MYDFVQTVVALSLRQLSVLMALMDQWALALPLKIWLENPLGLHDHSAQTSSAYIYQVLDTKSGIPNIQAMVIPWIQDFTGIHIPSLGYPVDTRFTSLDARLHWHTQTLAIPWMPDFTSFWIYRHWITFELKSFNFQQITET